VVVAKGARAAGFPLAMDPLGGSSGNSPSPIPAVRLESKLKAQARTTSVDDRLKTLLARETDGEKALLNLIEALKLQMVRVRADGVKDNVDKLASTFASLQRYRNDTITEAKKQLATERAMRQAQAVTPNVVDRVEATERKILGVLETVSSKLEQHDQAIAKIIEHGITPPSSEAKWTEVVKRDRGPAKKVTTSMTMLPTNRPAKTENAITGAQRSKTLRARHPAILVNVRKEDFPALAKKIRGGVNVEKVGDNVIGMRQTRTGALLIEVRGDSTTVETVRTEIARAAGEGVGVKALQEKCSVEIRDLDSWTSREEVAEAIARDTTLSTEEVSVVSLRSQYGGTQAAIIVVPRSSAQALLKAGRVRVGMISCRLRVADRPNRCFRCLGTGHVSATCTAKDRRTCCRRCGADGHFAVECTATIEEARSFFRTLKAESAVGTIPGEAAVLADGAVATGYNNEDRLGQLNHD